MKRLRSYGWRLTLLIVPLTCVRSAVAADSVGWQTDVNQAWKMTQQQDRPLLVFVTSEDCAYCVKMKNSTYADSFVRAQIAACFVPLELNGRDASPLVKDLHVESYPTTFIISPRAVILDRISGYVPPEALAKRLDAFRPRLQAVYARSQ